MTSELPPSASSHLSRRVGSRCDGLYSSLPGTGAIQGTVYDPSGRTVAKASVSIENDATHVAHTIVTNTDGLFAAPLLVPGSCSIAVKVEGFDEARACRAGDRPAKPAPWSFIWRHWPKLARPWRSARIPRWRRRRVLLSAALSTNSPSKHCLSPTGTTRRSFRSPRCRGPSARCNRTGPRNARRDSQWAEDHGKQHPVQRR